MHSDPWSEGAVGVQIVCLVIAPVRFIILCLPAFRFTNKYVLGLSVCRYLSDAQTRHPLDRTRTLLHSCQVLYLDLHKLRPCVDLDPSHWCRCGRWSIFQSQLVTVQHLYYNTAGRNHLPSRHSPDLRCARWTLRIQRLAQPRDPEHIRN